MTQFVDTQTPLRRRWATFRARGLALMIEHAPCCLLTAIAATIGLPLLNHNPVIELGFAIGGAMIGEYVGHRYILRHTCPETHAHTVQRYAIALAIGLITWGLHQILFHQH
jgi:hypothetical protein